MGYLANGVILASTVWFIYHISYRRFGGHKNNLAPVPNAKDTQSIDGRKETSSESGEISGSVEQAEPKFPSFTVDDGNESDDGERTPTKTTSSEPSKPEPPPSINLMPPPGKTPTVMAPPVVETPVSASLAVTTPSLTSQRMAPPAMAPPVRASSALAPPAMGPPPPRLKPPTFSAPPRSSGPSLRPPPSAASSLRAPPTVAPQSLTNSTLPANRRASSRQVTLTPGHSPLDWATLSHNPSATMTLRGKDATRISMAIFSSPHVLLRVPPTSLRRFNGRKDRDAWTSYQGRIYNVTPYLPFHPGGEPELLKGAGRASDKLFAEVHPWVNWEGMLAECCVGVLVSEEDERAIRVDRDANLIPPVGSAENEEKNPLDEMD